MLNRQIVALAIGLILIGPAGAQSGQILRTFNVSGWQANAFARSGQFTHCAASARYNSGVAMIFSINRSYEWSVGFTHPQWQLAQGAQYSVAFSIDGGAATYSQARALSATHATIWLQDSVDLFNRFRRGFVLRVAAANQVFTFNLEGSSAMLTALHRCVQGYVQPAAPPATSGTPNPFASTPAAAEPSSKTDPSLVAEATVVVANVMAGARVSGYSLGTPEMAAKLNVEAVWTAPGVVGTLIILPNTRTDSTHLAGTVIGYDAKSCGGKFISGSLPAEAGDGQRIYTVCHAPNGKTAASYYFTVARQKGGIYLFKTIANEGGRQRAEEADADIRSAALRIN